MSDVVCETCGRHWPWTPTVAGKRVPCICGGRVAFSAEKPRDSMAARPPAPRVRLAEAALVEPKLVMPRPLPVAAPYEAVADHAGAAIDLLDMRALPAATEAQPQVIFADALDNAYALTGSPVPRTPAPDAAHLPAPPLAQSAGPLAYRAPADDHSAFDSQKLKDFYMPLWLLGGGIAVELAAAALRSIRGGRSEFRQAVLRLVLEVLVNTPVMLIGVLLAAKLRDIKLGRFGTSVFKLAAVAVAPAAVLTLLRPWMMFMPVLSIFGFLVQFGLYFALLGVLFDLEEGDTWFFVAVICVLDVAMYFLV